MSVTCAMISLGCPKTLVDSEQMLGRLRDDGFTIAYETDGADVVILNTCGFLAASRDESMAEIRDLEARRRDPHDPLRCLIVAGCLVSRDKEELVRNCTDVDVFLDVFSRDDVVEAVRETLRANPESAPRKKFVCGSVEDIAWDEHRFPLLPPHVAYLKIAEGCNRRCAFCAIPNIRGKYSSKPLSQVVREAQTLVASGVKELILIAQDTSCYGMDLHDGKTSLATLLPELAKIEGLVWIRVMYLYPQNFGDELIEALATTPKVVPYIDMPLQHIQDTILKSMRRAVTRQETFTLLDKLRARIPHLAFRTAFIVGYPGERKQDFEELLAFVRKQQFTHVGVFSYSPEPGTPAAELPNPVPAAVARKRAEKLMAVQQRIVETNMERNVGKVTDVLLDAPLDAETWLGRTMWDAPDVDGRVYVVCERADNFQAGDLVSCRILNVEGYDRVAEPIE